MSDETEHSAPGQQGRKSRDRSKPKGPKKATPKYLENVARFYLERYATSVAGFRQYLLRKVQASAKAHGTDPQEGAEVVEALIEKYLKLNFLNDTRFAENRSGSLHRRGSSLRAIRQDLSLKGVAEEEVEKAVEQLREESDNPDLEAAVLYARRRRLGPYRLPEEREARREKDLAALGRRGFSFSLAEKVIDATDTEELEVEAGLLPPL